MNNLELVNKLYKPYRITKLNSCTIIDSLDGKFVLKPKGERDIKDLYSYLKSRGFNNYPNLVDSSRDAMNIYEYIDGSIYPKEQKASDLIKVASLLHNKTSYTKEVREDKFKEIYENIKNNLEYYKYEYTSYVDNIEEEIFMSPSHYLFIRNSSKLLNQIKFCETKLDEWYESVKDKREIRVCTVHNNLSLEHFVKGDKEALISWDKASTDSPILDIYELYQREWENVEFGSLLKEYLSHYPLKKEELDLLLIMLSMPKNVEFEKNEFKSCEKIGKVLDYVFKTEELVRPYYFTDDKV